MIRIYLPLKDEIERRILDGLDVEALVFLLVHV